MIHEVHIVREGQDIPQDHHVLAGISRVARSRQRYFELRPFCFLTTIWPDSFARYSRNFISPVSHSYNFHLQHLVSKAAGVSLKGSTRDSAQGLIAGPRLCLELLLIPLTVRYDES